MVNREAVQQAAARYARLAPRLDERSRRALIASEAVSLGPGNNAALARVARVSAHLIARGI